MNTTSYIMRVTAMQAISHIGKTASIGSIFNTEKVDGHDVPFITGGAMKGNLRRICMEASLSALGLDPENYDTDIVTDKKDDPKNILTQNRIETLFNGSILHNGGRGIDIGQGAYLSEMFAGFPLFGGCLGNMMMQGRIGVHPMTLICEENAERIGLMEMGLNQRLASETQIKLLPDKKMHSYRYYLSQQQNTHLDDFNRLGSPAMRLLPKEAKSEVVEARRLDFLAKQEPDYQDEGAGSHVQMRYNTQVLSAMSQFVWQIDTFDLTPLMEAAFHLTMSHFLSRPYVGGKRTYGMGYVHIQPLGKASTSLTPIKSEFSGELGFQAGDRRNNLYYNHLVNRRDEIIEAIKIIAEK